MKIQIDGLLINTDKISFISDIIHNEVDKHYSFYIVVDSNKIDIIKKYDFFIPDKYKDTSYYGSWDMDKGLGGSLGRRYFIIKDDFIKCAAKKENKSPSKYRQYFDDTPRIELVSDILNCYKILDFSFDVFESIQKIHKQLIDATLNAETIQPAN